MGKRLRPVFAVGLLLLSSACVHKDPPSLEDASVAPLAAGTAEPLAPRRDASAARRGDASVPQLARGDRSRLVSELARGRSLAQAKKWGEAAAAFEKALKLDPGNATVLSELSWAAFNAGDPSRAREAGEAAVRNTADPRLKAQALYNVGRALEQKGNRDEAAHYYRASLALRPNMVVEKRLAGLPDAKPPRAPRELPCANAWLDEGALFQCLSRYTGAEFVHPGELSVENERVEKLPPDYRIVRLEEKDGVGLAMYILVSEKPNGVLEPLAELARTWNPGAFGIHEEYTFSELKETGVGPRRVIEAHGRHEHYDADMGGMIVTTDTHELVTLCSVDGDKPPVCLPSIQLAATETLAYPMDPSQLSPEDRAFLAKAKKDNPPSMTSARAELVLAEGVATVTLKSGKADLLTAESLGPHKLW